MMLHQSVQSRIHFVKAHDIVLDWLKWLDISFADVLVLGKNNETKKKKTEKNTRSTKNK